MNGTIHTRMEPRDWALLLLLSLIWGGSFFLIGISVAQIPVLTLVALRVGFAALALWAICAVRGRPVPRDPKVWGAFFVMGLINNVLPFSLIAYAQTGLPAGVASILNATTPLFTVLVSAAVLADERASVMKLAGVVLGLGGVALMIGLDKMAGHANPLPNQLAMLGAAICYAFSGAYGRRFGRMGVDPLVTAAGMVTASTIMLGPVALAMDGWPHGIDTTHWLAAATLGILCTGVAYVLYFGILARAGATNISLVTFLVPVSAILLAWAFLDETLGPAHILGMAVIAAGLSLIDGRLYARKPR
ncbi:DMT family transporter [Paracoccus laeviglucosivorans]|uniref:Threonine/homoserine efflux transporter RhtA n=1 Tax=Paracoccus laeviglucosivorans TaxID=1197861 RepID=A0A521CM93_9RHOB|nr:DMT family transporter [Paracoccus laeviglucosivorans]SMO60563.1 Threonine/homoserine efflux transporter RhtA [Paracoccus laeviglucosivorans]